MLSYFIQLAACDTRITMTNASRNTNLKNVLARWGKRLLNIPSILIAVGVLIFLTQNRAAPSERLETETPRALSVIAAPKFDIQPRGVGFGTAIRIKLSKAGGAAISG